MRRKKCFLPAARHVAVRRVRAAHKKAGCIPLSQGVLTAIRHIVYVDFEKLFLFFFAGGWTKAACQSQRAVFVDYAGAWFQTMDFFTR